MNALKSTQLNEANSLAEQLEALLVTHEVTAAQLANALNLPLMTIRRLLSGETQDPRISTLTMIADYFHISVDSLMGKVPRSKPRFIPILEWNTFKQGVSVETLDLNNWKNWQPITANESTNLSEKAFALESRPSMFPRFAQGTIFVFDPNIKPVDGDLILVRFKESGELSLRELHIDPPQQFLASVISNSPSITFNPEKHDILGVNFLTMLYNRGRRHPN